MASNKSVALFFRVLFMLTLAVVLGACRAGGARHSLGAMVEEEDPQELPTNCESVLVVVAEDTCFDIARQVNLTTAELLAINLNIICDKLIPGQSLCVQAQADY